MQESDGLAFGANSRLLVDETDSRGAAPFEYVGEIIDGEADVMDAGTALGDEFADG